MTTSVVPSGWTPLGLIKHLGYAERHWFQEVVGSPRHPEPMGDEVADLRGIILHVIEETARHAGHLDIVRELLDGRTDLGPR